MEEDAWNWNSTAPILANQYTEESVMKASDRIEFRYGERTDWPEVPQTIILILQEYLFDKLGQRAAVRENVLATQQYTMHVLDQVDESIGIVGRFGSSAPIAAMVTEDFVTLGADVVTIVGGCGLLTTDIDKDDIIIADAAIRDEGTSYHYLPPSTTVSSSPGLVATIEKTMKERDQAVHVGKTWTTDGFYRETRSEIESYSNAGALCVEMEAAAVYSVAERRDVKATAVLAPFDTLVETDWKVKSNKDTRQQTLTQCFDAVVDGCLSYI